MKTKPVNKDFSAVEFMRKKRDELSELYSTNPAEFWEKLEEIRKKFKGKFRQKEPRK
ncbi:MAG: hypothetical protein R6W90_18930 [Ignavibacteriaceae bacterium]